MKQGNATTSRVGSTKTEPKSHGVPPAYASRLGAMQGNHVMDKGTIRTQNVPMYSGRGVTAPTVSSTSHKSGSQGKH